MGHQLVDHDFSFFFCLDETCRGGTPVSWQNIHAEKNSKNPKKHHWKKNHYSFLLILLTKALNLPKVMYVLGTLIYFCKIISCMLYQSNLPFLLRNKVQCLTVGYMKMKLVYHVLSFFCIMLHSWSRGQPGGRTIATWKSEQRSKEHVSWSQT